MPDVYSGMTGPAAPERTALRKQCSHSQRSASLELRVKKEGGFARSTSKTRGKPRCRNLQFNDWQSQTVYWDLHCTKTNRLQDSTSRNEYIHTHSLFINICIFIAVAMGFQNKHQFPNNSPFQWSIF